LGFDIVVHSATKFLNGHSDVIAGVVAGRKKAVEGIRATANILGPSIDPHAAFLLARGLRTLGLRVARQNANALALARALAASPKVVAVHYPGLETSPSYKRAAALFTDGGCGGVLSFEPAGGVDAAEALMARLQLALVAPSLGGVETLVTRPATTSHAGLSPAARVAAGIKDELVRVAVGVEDTEDLVADFERALAAI
jgi:cystathionine gamma-synthase/cystathionine gamma-lyase/cystathionine beta-lyase